MKANRNTLIISGDRIFNLVNIAVLSLLTILIVFPVWNVVVNSFSSGKAIAESRSLFWPSEFSLENYRAVMNDTSIWSAFMISILKTVIGVVCHVLFCSMVAYGMSKNNLIGRKVYTVMGVITMFFSGGIIPTYMLIKSLNLLNSFWVYIIPALFSYYDMIILMIFFKQVPDSLEESARIDGAGVWRVFGAIILPLSKPALATIALYHGVSQWNDFMTTKLYITNKALYPLMMKLYEIIVQQQLATMANNTSYVVTTSTKGIQLATIVVTTLPIVIIYPMLQKHFVTGMMLGAVKE
jgi:putative aldouronate transport system permease protein